MVHSQSDVKRILESGQTINSHTRLLVFSRNDKNHKNESHIFPSLRTCFKWFLCSEKGSWHQSKCTWLKISWVILKVTEREPAFHMPLLFLPSCYSSWGAQKKNFFFLLILSQERNSKLLHELPYLWGHRFMQISCRTQSSNSQRTSDTQGPPLSLFNTCWNSWDRLGEKMLLALCASPGLPDKQLRTVNSWLGRRLPLNQSWEDSPYWH